MVREHLQLPVSRSLTSEMEAQNYLAPVYAELMAYESVPTEIRAVDVYPSVVPKESCKTIAESMEPDGFLQVLLVRWEFEAALTRTKADMRVLECHFLVVFIQSVAVELLFLFVHLNTMTDTEYDLFFVLHPKHLWVRQYMPLCDRGVKRRTWSSAVSG